MKHLATFICISSLPFLLSCGSSPSKPENSSKPAAATARPINTAPSTSASSTSAPSTSAPSEKTESPVEKNTIIPDKNANFDSRSYSVYGNWCGPNHPKDINNAPDPIDRLDAACMNHDICYANKGYLDCNCDQAMNAGIKQDLNGGVYTLSQILVARNIHRYFSASPCNGDGNGKIAPSRAAHKIYNRVKNKVSNILDRVLPD